MTFSDKMVRLAQTSGWTQTQLCRAIGQWPSTYIRWMKHKSQPTKEDLKRICEVFKTDANWLIDDDQEWDDQPGLNWEVNKFAKAINMIQRIGADEALKRLSRASDQPAETQPRLAIESASEVKPTPKRRKTS